MKKEKIFIESLTIKMSVVLLKNYKKFCDDNGHNLSKRLRFFMEKDMEDKLEIKK